MTASCFASSAVFDLSALTAISDPDLRPGVHVRVITAPAAGLPLAPFVLFPLPVVPWSPVLAWTRPDRTPASPGDPVQIGNLASTLPDGLLPVAWEVERRSGITEVQTLSRDEDRVFARAVEAPFLLPLSGPSRLAVLGKGGTPSVRGWAVDLSSPSLLSRALEGQIAEERILSLPVDGDRPWYAGGRGVGSGRRRVETGAPLRLGPPDAIEPPFGVLSPASELARLAMLTPGLDPLLQLALDDPGRPPKDAVFEQVLAENVSTATPAQWADIDAARAVLAQSLDPTLGRYLGYLARLPGQPTSILDSLFRGIGLSAATRDGGAPTAWGVAGVFGIDRTRLDEPSGHPVLPPPDATEGALHGRMISLFPGLRDVSGRAHRCGLEVRALVAVAAAVPAWTPPAAPRLALGEASWSRSPGGSGPGAPERFRQLIEVVDPPVAPLVAVASRPAGGSALSPAHQIVVTAPPARRASRLLGHSAPSDAAGKADGERAWVVEAGLVAADAPFQYRIRLGDLFGRFGDPAEIATPAPPRPRPPRPEPHLTPLAAPRAADLNAAPWGALDARIPVPAPGDLAAGALPITTLEWSWDGGPWRPEPVTGLAVLTRTLALPSLGPQASTAYSIALRFRDAAGEPSDIFRKVFRLTDPRQPPPVRSGTGIVWTSRPGPTEEVELDLTWKGTAGARFRAYMCDAATVGVRTTETDGRPKSRAQIAALGTSPGVIPSAIRSSFQLLTDPAVTADVDGTVRLRTRLPRRLTDVRFVTIVELSAAGVEGAFGGGGLTAVAVPQAQAPPPPRLLLSSVDHAARSVTLRIEAEGLDIPLLQASEPGLFGLPGPGVAPRYRIRRTGGRQGEPLYAEIIHEGDLAMEAAGDAGQRFAATFTDGLDIPLHDFVEYAYWAEVQMPPERRLPPGVIPIPGAVSGSAPAQNEDQPGLWSTASVCVVALPAPTGPALADGQLTVRVVATAGTAATIALALSTPPVVHRKAVGSYTLRVWLPKGPDDGVAAPLDLSVVSTGLFSTQPDMLAGAQMIKAAFVDPLGRRGPVRDIAVT